MSPETAVMFTWTTSAEEKIDCEIQSKLSLGWVGRVMTGNKPGGEGPGRA